MKLRMAVGRCCCIPTPTEIELYRGWWIQGSGSALNMAYAATTSNPAAGHIREDQTYVGPSYTYVRIKCMVLFANVPLGPANTVDTAFLTLSNVPTTSGEGTLVARVIGYDADNTDDPNTAGPWATPLQVDAAARTTAATANFTVRVLDSVDSSTQEVVTPNCASIINEIIQRPGWTPGNNLILFIEETASIHTGNPFGINQLGVRVNQCFLDYSLA